MLVYFRKRKQRLSLRQETTKPTSGIIGMLINKIFDIEKIKCGLKL